MFSASTDYAKQPEPKPLGKDSATLATEEHGRPVPYLAGRRKLSLTWISDAWGVRSQPIKRKVGKSKQVVGYNYFASFAGILCLGPVQTLHNIWVDDQIAWEGPLAANTDDSASITVEGRGVLTIYWGTETQDVDLTLAASGILHPAYRGQCYVVFDDWLLGENRSSVPAIEFELTRIPQNSGLSVNAALNEEVNPVAALEELLTSKRFGAGVDAATLDYTSFDATAAALEAESFSVSVFLDQATKLDALLAEFLEYLDAALVHTQSGTVGLRLLREAPSPVAIGADDLTEAPNLVAHGWPETVNEVVVRFSNRNRDWQTDSVAARDPSSYAITKRTVSQSVECDWITDQAVAWRVALGLARSRSLPWLDGSLRARKDVAGSLRPGDTVELTYATHGIDAAILRVTGVEVPGPDSAEVVLQVREDTSHLLGDDYLLDADPSTEITYFEPLPCDDVLAVELPFGWTQNDKPYVLFVPARGDTLSNRFTVHWERREDSFKVAVEGNVFGCVGTLNADLPASGLIYHEGGLDVTITSPDDDIEDMPFSEGVENNRFLVFVGNEIMLGWTATLTAPDRYTISVMRGQAGTLRSDHVIGDKVWLVQVDEGLEVATWKAPDSWSQVIVKVQTHLLQCDLALADADEITVPLIRRAVRPLGPTNLTAQGDGVCPLYSTGADIVLDWTLTSELRSQTDPTVDADSRARACVLELWDGATLKKTLTVDERGPYTITNAHLIEYLGSEISFTVNAYLARGKYRSVDFNSITVTKI